jgi:hypothetical protein
MNDVFCIVLSLLSFFFPLTPHRGGICPLEFRIVSTSQLYQFIGQYCSRPTIIEKIHVV